MQEIVYQVRQWHEAPEIRWKNDVNRISSAVISDETVS